MPFTPTSLLTAFRTQPIITPEQKLRCRLETLSKQAEDLQQRCTQLHEEAESLSTRAKATKAPEGLAKRASQMFGKGREMAQAGKEHYSLMEDWKGFQRQATAFGKDLTGFVKTVEARRKDAVGKEVDVEFEGLDGAIYKLREEKVKLGKAIAGIGLE